MNSRTEQLKALDRLITIMDELREGCPWDRKQTMQTLRQLTIEETYELGDAILENDLEEVKKELGDLLLHIVFYARIGSETGDFDLADVANDICEKLIRRHPHIYGDTEVADAEQVKANWEKIKLQEGKKSVLQGVPLGLPALVKANRVQEKVAGVGFDWEAPEQVFEKVREELEELEAARAGKDRDALEAEMGDVFFSLVNYSRFLGINPEDALERTNKKFIRRFQFLEERARQAGRSLHEMTLAEMDVHWEAAKAHDPKP
ncbi:nucleoside triphosphate pyrophosphohydrolase [Robiginitalea sediminis]|uniref:nucleoside triphosphate pyrophosphohydrolase n=1 Tax=Robiginitalea sediminis TaxID=1982593 RepID=UPI000B4A5871|nr:nucleoside triphosphate pyrophosphohydrolase [Robiginitalea sediminis]